MEVLELQSLPMEMVKERVPSAVTNVDDKVIIGRR
jgi:hypothetical protein